MILLSPTNFTKESSTITFEEMNKLAPLGLKPYEVRQLFNIVRRLPNPELVPTRASSQGAQPLKSNDTKTELLKFPVQPLNETLEKYVRSVRPLVNNNELNTTIGLVENFAGKVGVGPKLQKLLEERALVKENWFQEWWLNIAYLEYRDPVIVYSSPGLVWPQIHLPTVEDQIKFATSVIAGALSFNDILNEKKIPQEKIGGRPADMQQYYQVFGTTRIPRPKRDVLLYQDNDNPSDTIIVMHNNHIFSVQVYEDKDGKKVALNETQIYGQLQHVVSNSSDPAPPLGVLTSNNRDKWAEAYKYLLESRSNVAALEAINKSLFIVCIDKPLPPINPPNDQSRTGALTIHGCGVTKGNGGNRWFDKTIQFIVGAGSDGVGLTYEHSPAEGVPIGVLTDYIFNKISKNTLNLKPPVTFPKPQKLTFDIDKTVEKHIQDAATNIDSLAQNLDIWGFTFKDFGKNRLKTLKVSPDSFIQIAIQYAFYRVHKEPAAQYESGSLRKFIHGRTDVIRTCSSEALDFCKTVSSPSTTEQEKYKALIAAINGHRNYTMAVVDGKGIDRHLTGLKLIAAENQIETPKLFTDAAYKNSTYFKLSTSNVPTNCDGFMIYGPLVKDGYACCYNPRNDTINFGTTAWRDTDKTGLKSFKESLEFALRDMENILANNTPPSSKL